MLQSTLHMIYHKGLGSYRYFLCMVKVLKARVYYSYSVIHNPTLLPQRPLEPSQFSVGISDTQRNSPPDRFYMLTTNHVNSVENKLPKLNLSLILNLIWCFISP